MLPNAEKSALTLIGKHLDPVVATRIPTHSHLSEIFFKVDCCESMVFEPANQHLLVHNCHRNWRTFGHYKLELRKAIWVKYKNLILHHPKEQIFGRVAQAVDWTCYAELHLCWQFMVSPHGHLLRCLFWLLAVNDQNQSIWKHLNELGWRLQIRVCLLRHQENWGLRLLKKIFFIVSLPAWNPRWICLLHKRGCRLSFESKRMLLNGNSMLRRALLHT